MNVYVEANFVLELALMQEEHENCENILLLCESAKAKLIVPAFSLTEPYETLVRRDKDRKQLAQTVKNELRELGRSKPYQTETSAYQAFANLLTRSGKEEQQRLFYLQDRLLMIGEIIPLGREILSAAAQFQIKHGLSPQDSIVYASVLQHLQSNAPVTSCFLNRNSRDFDDPDIEESLAHYHCKVLFSFNHGFEYIQRFA